MSTLKTTNIAHPSSASNNIVLDSSGNATLATAKITTLADSAGSNTSTPAAIANGIAKAWVNFDGTASGTFAGGTSTVTRTAGSTTATVTTTNAHGLITGNTVYALTGVVAGTYTVTVLTSTTFTITTVATTALSAASITFAVNSIRASYNVSSITDNGVGDYTVNFTTAMVDANYSVALGRANTASGIVNLGPNTSLTTSAFSIYTLRSDTAVFQDSAVVCATVFR